MIAFELIKYQLNKCFFYLIVQTTVDISEGVSIYLDNFSNDSRIDTKRSRTSIRSCPRWVTVFSFGTHYYFLITKRLFLAHKKNTDEISKAFGVRQ